LLIRYYSSNAPAANASFSSVDRVYKVVGMDSAEKVAVLKQAVDPLLAARAGIPSMC
jgi:hypothetical protein